MYIRFRYDFRYKITEKNKVRYLGPDLEITETISGKEIVTNLQTS